MGSNSSWSLRPELTMDYPFGGTIKLPSSATIENLKVLDLLGSRHIILIRHPADYLVALYCYYARKAGAERDRPEGRYQDVIQRLKNFLFLNLDEMAKTFSHLIGQGYLHGSLSWMLAWIQARDLKNSVFVRYKDVLTAPVETLDRVGKFLYEKPLDEPTSEACQKILSKTPHANIYTEYYPRGYMGEVGVWRKYFFPEHVGQYQNVVTSFMHSMSQADLLKSQYPDIGIES